MYRLPPWHTYICTFALLIRHKLSELPSSFLPMYRKHLPITLAFCQGKEIDMTVRSAVVPPTPHPHLPHYFSSPDKFPPRNLPDIRSLVSRPRVLLCVAPHPLPQVKTSAGPSPPCLGSVPAS